MNSINKSIRGLLFALSFAATLPAQTIYTPGGTVGNIGGSYVGIGTSSPATKLDVQGGYIRAQDAGAASGAFMEGANGVSYFGNVGVGDIYLGNSNNWGNLVIKNGGNVGIGTTAPNTTLHLRGSSAKLRVDGAGSGDPELRLSGASGSVTRDYALGTDGAQRFYLYDYTSSAYRMIVDNSGNVGIGTTTPGSLLHIKHPSGNLAVRFEGFTNAYASKLFLSSVSSGDGGLQYDANDNTMSVFSYGDVKFDVGTGNISGAIANERMRITQSGNVGIGTTNPTQKLAVNGTIRAKEIIVDTGWSDYVFKPDYRLASLSEVEGSIQREGHLPGIPSAQEVADHGVGLGEMQSKLLAKVEELTLHLIAQEKRIAQLERENAALQNR